MKCIWICVRSVLQRRTTRLLANVLVPNLINYQGVALNTSGTPIANQLINIRASIHDATTTGTVVFSEDRTVTTDATGLFDLQIGSTGAVNTFGTLNNVAEIRVYASFVTISP